jgi:Cu/Ag efflux protein CusF
MKIRGFIAAALAATAFAAYAQTAQLADGEVRRVDREQQRVTLRHGPIPSLDMPPMTMVFRVGDPALLDGLNAGDKVRFDAEKIGSHYTVTRIEIVR